MIPADLASSCHAAASAAASASGENWLEASGVLLAGLLGTIMPCTVQMATILATLLAEPREEAPPGGPSMAAGRWASRLAAFLAGYALTFLAAAGAASLLIRAAGTVVGVWALQIAGGVALAAFGMQILGWVRLPGGGACGGPVGFFLGGRYRSTPRPSRMGVSFALYCAGCCGPAALGSALLLTGGTSITGAMVLLLAYAAGMAIPFIILAAGLLFALGTMKRFVRHVPALSAAGGVLAIAAGFVLALRPLSGLMG